ncbi:MAG: hypothetical protein ACE5G1_01600 [bacterium]
MKFSIRAFQGFSILAVFCLLTLSCSGDAFVESNDLSSISGTITFDNVMMWPDSGEVQVTIWPQGVWTASGPIGPPQNATEPVTIVRNGIENQYGYLITGLPDGEYSAVTVGWRHPDETLPAEQRSAVLGVYLSDPNMISTGLVIPNTPFQGPLPSVISVKKEDRTKVDIRADFAFLALFFPPGTK